MNIADDAKRARRTVLVSELTDGILDPAKPMLGPLIDGGTIVGNTAPGCWGPMITPRIRGGHEVTRPVFIDGAEPGDSVAIRIRDVNVTSFATASGHDRWVEGHYLGDPYAAPRCPNCGTLYPDTYVSGIGQQAVHCVKCNTPVTPFQIVNGYTTVFDDTRHVGVTVPKEAAEQIAESATRFAALPESSVQHSILTYAPHDLVGLAVRLRPFLGQLGTMPAIRMPDSHNAGDFGSALVGAPHEYAITADQLELRTDGHMDIDAVRPGAIVIAPVKVPGAGIYFGDMHAMQGDGEIAGHTMDVSGTVTLRVDLLKGRTLEGPVLFPLLEDLPPLARPLDQAEMKKACYLAAQWGLKNIEQSAPISIVGSGPNLNSATQLGLQRAADLLSMTVPEVMNRATITGAIQIGRHPGVVQITFLAPLTAIEKARLLPFVQEQYGIG
ncbi:MAG TPA: acetamidase/formamidase family protein [Chthoniobacterales bacterium]|nr:acetamidase/formamidase family protein [Chthoniobacterales bacterium]